MGYVTVCHGSCLSFEECSMICWEGSMCWVREIHLDVVLLNLRRWADEQCLLGTFFIELYTSGQISKPSAELSRSVKKKT